MRLKTARLLIREFTLDDLGALKPILGNPQVMEFSLSGPMSGIEAENYLRMRILANYQKYGHSFWALILPEQEQLIGLAGLLTQEIEGKTYIELAYRLHPDYWGKGYATEAGLAISQHAFDVMGLEQIISCIEERNVASPAVAKRLGMVRWKKAVFHDFHIWIYLLNRLSVQPFQEAWSQQYEQEKARLESAFEGLPVEFHHIGSTAIKGCAAKPIIDILGVTPDVTQIDVRNDAMRALGYETLGEFGMKQRRFFRKRGEGSVSIFTSLRRPTLRLTATCAFATISTLTQRKSANTRR